MYAIRIDEVINDKDVVIPFSLLKSLNHQDVEIIVISKPKTSIVDKNRFSKLLSKYSGVSAFEDIIDAISWQKKVRNEWS